jgi:hypothetical protein
LCLCILNGGGSLCVWRRRGLVLRPSLPTYLNPSPRITPNPISKTSDLFKAGKGPDPKVAKVERAKSNLDSEMDAYWEAKNK